jgi:hypothetical protein
MAALPPALPLDSAALEHAGEALARAEALEPRVAALLDIAAATASALSAADGTDGTRLVRLTDSFVAGVRELQGALHAEWGAALAGGGTVAEAVRADLAAADAARSARPGAEAGASMPRS